MTDLCHTDFRSFGAMIGCCYTDNAVVHTFDFGGGTMYSGYCRGLAAAT